MGQPDSPQFLKRYLCQFSNQGQEVITHPISWEADRFTARI
jgi:hypothetical protein